MLQPLVENAIYHGMEYMDGDGEIFVRAWQEEKELYLEVRDNGLGMTEEQVESLFTDTAHVASKRGSGIGVRNVNERIKLYFGAEYGLSIESEPNLVGKMINSYVLKKHNLLIKRKYWFPHTATGRLYHWRN